MSKEDMNTILNEAVDVALYFLEKNGEFFPFGVVMTSNQDVRHVQGWTDEEQPQSEKLISHLKEGMRQFAEKGEYISVALISDVRLNLPDSGGDRTIDAVRIMIDDKDDDPVICYLPYSISDCSLSTGEMKFEPAESFIFFDSVSS